MRQSIAATANQNVPRYTSYPTAPHFHAGVNGETFANWLGAVPDGDRVSLYIHVPFCDRLCWFCACHTKQTRRYDPILPFLEALKHEIATVGTLIGERTKISALHFGGGSPTMLVPADLVALMECLRETFTFADNAEISIEIDPNDMDEARLDALAAIGVTRASLGIQDFDPKVQAAINREQSFERTKRVVEGLRDRGIVAVNLDLLYGLPHQTCESMEATLRKALSLDPDRVALFGYAHVPWMKKHQRMIDEGALPGAEERLRQSAMASALIVQSGYEAIGIDHFALPGDSLALAAREGRLHRNFQGYTDDDCQTLVGLGPSSISRLRQGYTQNVAATGVYSQQVTEGNFATTRGVAFTPDDLARGWVIERLMCAFEFSGRELVERFGANAAPVLADAARLATDPSCPHFEGADGSFRIPEQSRRLARTVAAQFDAFFLTGKARHSAAV